VPGECEVTVVTGGLFTALDAVARSDKGSQVIVDLIDLLRATNPVQATVFHKLLLNHEDVDKELQFDLKALAVGNGVDKPQGASTT